MPTRITIETTQPSTVQGITLQKVFADPAMMQPATVLTELLGLPLLPMKPRPAVPEDLIYKETLSYEAVQAIVAALPGPPKLSNWDTF